MLLLAAPRPRPRTVKLELPMMASHHSGIGDVVHLAVQQLSVPDGADVHLLPYPKRAVAGDALLFEAIGELQTFVFNFECFLVGFIRVEGGDKTRFTEEEIQVLNFIEMRSEFIVGINREIRGDNRKPRARKDFGFEEVGDGTAPVVVPDSRICRRIWH